MMEEALETPSASLREYTVPSWDDRPAKPPFISLGYKSRRDLQGLGTQGDQIEACWCTLLQPFFVLRFIACAAPTPRCLQTTQSHVFNRFKSQLL
jgi:hypothetical protein